MRVGLLTMVSLALLLAAPLAACEVEIPPVATQRTADAPPQPSSTPCETEAPAVARPATVAPTQGQVQTPAPTPEPQLTGVITVWHSIDQANSPAVEEILQAFMERNPNVGFRVSYVPESQMSQRLADATANGSGPDLVIAGDRYARPWRDQALIQDLAPLPDGAAMWEGLDPLALSLVQDDDAVLGLPLTLHGMVLLRNRALVAEASATWEELIAAAQAATQGDVAGARLDRGMAYTGAHLIAMGGAYADEQGQPAFADEHGLAWIALLRAYEQADPGATLNQPADAIEAFAAGKVGYLVASSERIPHLADAIGAGNLAVDPWPTWQGQPMAGFLHANVAYLGRCAAGARQEIALAFMRYLAGEAAQGLFGAYRQIPARAGVTVQDPLQQEVAAIIPHLVPLAPAIPSLAYVTELDKALAWILGEGGDPQAGLDVAADALRSAMEASP